MQHEGAHDSRSLRTWNVQSANGARRDRQGRRDLRPRSYELFCQERELQDYIAVIWTVRPWRRGGGVCAASRCRPRGRPEGGAAISLEWRPHAKRFKCPTTRRDEPTGVNPPVEQADAVPSTSKTLMRGPAVTSASRQGGESRRTACVFH